MIFSYGSRRLRTNAFSFCRAAALANSEISFIDCRLSFGSLVHWRMIFRRASRCFFITSCIDTLLEVDYSGSALTGGALPLFRFFQSPQEAPVAFEGWWPPLALLEARKSELTSVSVLVAAGLPVGIHLQQLTPQCRLRKHRVIVRQ